MLQGLKLFRIWRFEFVSDFEIRISDFPVAAIAALSKCAHERALGGGSVNIRC
jgi:hypothetical protein